MITTARLLLQRLAADDIGVLAAYHRRNADRLSRFDRPVAVAAYAAWLGSLLDEEKRGTSVTFVARSVAPPSVDPVGIVHFDSFSHDDNDRRSAIVSYSVDAAFEGRGYASEMLDAAIRYVTTTLGVRHVVATYHPENERSGRLLRRAGFAIEAMMTDIPPAFAEHMRPSVTVGLIIP